MHIGKAKKTYNHTPVKVGQNRPKRGAPSASLGAKKETHSDSLRDKIKRDKQYKKQEGSLVATAETTQSVKKGKPVAVDKVIEGLEAAVGKIEDIISVINCSLQSSDISEVELTISFDAQGKLLGIGVGGATSITIRIKPLKKIP